MHITHSPAVGATFPFVYQVIWSGRQDSNLRPPVPKTGVLTNWTTSRNVWFSIILRITTNPWELVSFTPTSDFHRRSPLVCTQPLWNSHCLLTCSLPSLSSIRFHIVLGILIPWILTLWVYTWALFVFHFSYWSWTCLNNRHFLYFIVLLGSGCGSRTQLSWGYEPQMIFEHPYFRSSYPFHSPANFLFISKNLSRQPDSNR